MGKKDLVLAWVCICFMFLGMTFFGSYLIRKNNSYDIFEQKCERVNINHLTLKMLRDNRNGFLLTDTGCYRIKDLVFEKWARMLDKEKIVIVTEEALKQLQKNFGLTKGESNGNKN